MIQRMKKKKGNPVLCGHFVESLPERLKITIKVAVAFSNVRLTELVWTGRIGKLVTRKPPATVAIGGIASHMIRIMRGQKSEPKKSGLPCLKP